MTRKRGIIMILILLLIGGACFFYFRKTFPDHMEFRTDFFMRNLSWQTDFWSEIPYKKDDTLEYMSVISSDSPRDISININDVKKIIDIDSIELDEHAINENMLSSVHLTGSSLLKITGKSKGVSENKDTVEKYSPIKITTLQIEKKSSIEKKPEIPSSPEPKDLRIVNNKYNSNINNLLTITGQNLDSVEIVNIGWVTFKPVFSSGSLFVQIDRDTFASGEYFIFFSLRNGKIIARDEKIYFEHSDAKINIANITPAIIKNNEDRFVVIQGNGFDKIISVQLSNNLILKNAEFHIINKQVAGVRIPKGLAPGEYYFNIMDTSAIYELKNMRFTISSE